MWSEYERQPISFVSSAGEGGRGVFKNIQFFNSTQRSTRPLRVLPHINMSIDLTIGSIGDISLKDARQQKTDSIKNLSSGKKQDMAWKDSGSYSLGLRLENQKRYESGLSASLQNAMSIAQSQEDALNRMSKLLSKMNELAGQASSVGVLSADRENYQAAFAGFVDDFEKIQSETFNDKSIFGNTMGDEEKQFLDSLKNHWLKATEDLIKQEYGWDPVPSDSWDLVIEENGATGGSAAFVMTAQYSNGTADVIKMSFDLPDFNAPHTQPQSTTDRVVAHEMVHLLHAQNTYYADPTGDGSSSAKWLKEAWLNLYMVQTTGSFQFSEQIRAMVKSLH